MGNRSQPMEDDPEVEPRSVEAQLVRDRAFRALFGGDPQPAKIGRFAVLGKLGEGGMGRVFSAYDPRLKREVAVKLLHAEAGHDGDSAGRTRLVREAQAMARLSHPNVLPVFETGEHEGQVFVAMELVGGTTLRQWQRGRSPQSIIEMYVQAARGLHAAHQAGLVHRDFKPENVMVGDDGRARVMDFGLARPLSESQSEAESVDGDPDLDVPVTRTGSILGTPAYMAPEQFQGRTADARSDLFSWCVALWEALFEARPFAGDTIALLEASVCRGDIRPPPRSVVIPRRVELALRRGLAAEPAARFGSMPEVVAEIEQSPRRGRWGVAAALAGAAAVGFAALSSDTVEPSAPPDPCADAGSELDTVWNEQRRDAIAAAMQQAAPGRAANVVEFATKGLDTYRDAWHLASRETCRGLTDDPGSERLASRRRCLDDRRIELEAAVGVLVEDGSTLLNSAPHVVIELPKVGDCDDDRLLRAEARDRSFTGTPEAHGVARKAVARLRSRMIGEIKNAQEARDVLEVVREAGSPSLEAEALFLLGTVLHSVDQAGEATGVLQEAMTTAEAVGHDRIAARAAASLAFVARSNPDVAQLRLERARVLVERTHDPEATFRTRFTESRIALRQGDYAHARAMWTELQQYVAEAMDPDHRFIGYVAMQQWLLAERLGEFDRVAEVMASHTRWWNRLEHASPWFRCTSALDVARAWYLAGRPDEISTWTRECAPPPEGTPAQLDIGHGYGSWRWRTMVALFSLDDPAVVAARERLVPWLYRADIPVDPAFNAFQHMLDTGDFAGAQRMLDFVSEMSWHAAATAFIRVEKGSCDGVTTQWDVTAGVSAPVASGPSSCAAERGEREEALRLLDAAKQAGVDDLRLYYRTLEVHARLGDFERVVELAQGRPPAWDAMHRERRFHSGIWGLALLELGDSEGALAKLGAADVPYARTEWDQRFRFALAKAIVATGGSRERATRIAGQARDRWRALGAGNEGRLAEVEAWLSSL